MTDYDELWKAAGTQESEYAPARDAPFNCGHCGFLEEPHYCLHKDVIEDAKNEEPDLKVGRYQDIDVAVVDQKACCRYKITDEELERRLKKLGLESVLEALK